MTVRAAWSAISPAAAGRDKLAMAYIYIYITKRRQLKQKKKNIYIFLPKKDNLSKIRYKIKDGL